jgi:hypothetical protein
MALVLKDRVKETTTTTGTGTVTLAGASTGYQSFSVIGNANTTYYCIAGQGTAEWEVGIGTYTASGTTLSRDTILASSNSGSVVTFSAGTKDVFVVYPAGKSVNQDASGNVGIGTTSPTAKLHTVVTDASSVLTLERTGAGATSFTADFSGAIFNQSLSGGADYVWKEGGTEWMRLTNTGNLGIGTTSPTNKLTVDGNANITGNTTLGDATTDTVTVNGYVGVGGGGVVGNGLQVVSSALSGVNQTGVYSALVGTSGGTNRVRAFLSFPASAAASYTVNDMSGFWAADVSKGAGSTITNLHGLYIADQTQGTNNYGITSVVSSGANKWNIYASGTAENYFAGNVGIGAVAGSTTGQLRIAGNGSGATTFNGISLEISIQSGVTSAWRGLLVRPTTQATAFTLSNLYGVYVNPQTFGAGSTVTNQFGFHAENTLTGATNNYGFYSNIASGTGRWNFYANGTAANYFAGRVLIGTATSNAAFAGNLQFEGTATDFSMVRYAAAAGAPNLYFGKSRGATVGTNTIVSSNDPLGNIIFTGANGTGYDTAAYIQGSVDGTPGASGDMPGRLTFWTTPDGSATPAERMRIDSSGNVGIGVSPSTKLDVSGTSRYTFNVSNAYTLQTSLNAAGSAFADDYKNALSHIWQTSGTERMRINSSGNVGIGTSSPTTKTQITKAALTGFVSRTAATLTLENSGDTELYFASGNANVGQLRFGDDGGNFRGAISYDHSSDGFLFYTAGTERMRIDSSGNVGIGTSSPTAKLHTVVTDASSVLILERTGAGATSFTADFSGAVFNQSLSAGADYVWKEGGTEWMRLTNTGNVGIGTSSPTAKLDVSSDVIRLRTAKTPASASATGNAGDIAWDSSYIYVCVATNTWKRVAIATW